ncbi:hypothetical protein HK096_010583, partial [Nowakowskiella sp. JEL0078]
MLIPEFSEFNGRWVQFLKEYIKREGPRHDFANQAKNLNTHFRECDVLVDYYMSNKPLSTSWSHEGDDLVQVEVAQSVVWSFGQLYRSLKQLLAAIPDRDRIISRAFENDLFEFNVRVVHVVNALVDFTPNALLTESEGEMVTVNPLKPSLVAAVAMAREGSGCDEDREDVDAKAKLRSCIYLAAGVSKRVIRHMEEHLVKIIERADLRVSRSLLMEWHRLCVEFMDALQKLGVKSIPPDINHSGDYVSTEISSKLQLHTNAKAATDAANNLLTLLRDYPNRLRGIGPALERRQPPDLSNPDSNYRKDQLEQATVLERYLKQVERSTGMLLSLRTIGESDSKAVTQKNLLEMNAFVKAVIQLSEFMRDVTSMYLLPEDVK